MANRTLFYRSCVGLFCLFCLAMPALTHAQTFPGDGEDYYLWLYYYGPPPPKPPEQIKEDTVNQTITQGGSNRITKNFRKVSKVSKIASSVRGAVFQPRVKAGDWLDNLSLSLDYSLAEVHDSLLQGHGKDRDLSIFASTTLGDDYSLGLGVAQNRYHIGGSGDYEQHTESADLMFNWFIDEYWLFGVFMSTSRIDIEDDYRININTLQLENLADSYERYGCGAMLALNIPVGDYTNVGITNSLTSMNKKTIGRFFDDEDSAWLLMVDVNHALTADLSVSVFGTSFNALDRNEGAADSSYYIFGADLMYRLTESTSISIGYDTTAADKDRDEWRMNLGLVLEF